MTPIDYSARKLLAENLARLMADHPDKSTPAKLAKVARWPSGKKRGREISERQIRYALDIRTDAVPAIPSPTLDLVIRIANAFDVPAWKLLAPRRVHRVWELGKLFTYTESVSDGEVEKHLPLPPRETSQASKKKRKPGHP